MESEFVRNFNAADLAAHKPVNIIFIGHVDAGKSTLNGRLLVDTSNIDPRALERIERDAAKDKMTGWALARVMDSYDEERERGKTMDCGFAFFMSEQRKYYLIDAPGHANLVPRMAATAHQADVACLLVSSRQGEFEAGLAGQTREHAMIVKTAGVRALVVVVNKLDDPSVQWSEERFKQCAQGIQEFTKKIGFAPNMVSVVPCSALTGDGVTHPVPSTVAPWVAANGYKSLLEVLDNLKLPPLRDDAPFMMAVFDSHRDPTGIIARGKIDSGSLTVGDKVVVAPTGVTAEVAVIKEDEVTVEHAVAGDNVTMMLKGIDEGAIEGGSVLCSPEHVISSASEVTAQLMVMGLPNADGVEKPISRGYKCMAHVHAVTDEITISEVIAILKFDKAQKKFVVAQRATKNGPPLFILANQQALVRVKFASGAHPVTTKDDPADRLSRFVLREDQQTVAVGLITKLK